MNDKNYKAILILLFLLFIVPLTLTSQQLIQDMNDFVYESYIQDSEYVVTGINWDDKLLSFKHTYYVPFHDGRGDFLQPIDCNYPGLSNKPGYAVTVGVYDFGNSRYDRVFHIYEAAKVPDECTDFNTSSTRLNDAKEYFNSSGIDYTNIFSFKNDVLVGGDHILV